MLVIAYLSLGLGAFALFSAIAAYAITIERKQLTHAGLALAAVLAVYFYWIPMDPIEIKNYGMVLILPIIYVILKSISSITSHYYSNENHNSDKEDFIVLISKAVLPIESIQWIEVNGKYCHFHLRDKTTPEIDRISLKQLANKLPKDTFRQINRSTLVNREFIAAVNGHQLQMKDGQCFQVKSRYRQDD